MQVGQEGLMIPRKRQFLSNGLGFVTIAWFAEQVWNVLSASWPVEWRHSYHSDCLKPHFLFLIFNHQPMSSATWCFWGKLLGNDASPRLIPSKQKFSQSRTWTAAHGNASRSSSATVLGLWGQTLKRRCFHDGCVAMKDAPVPFRNSGEN